jgi:hypothetical protein
MKESLIGTLNMHLLQDVSDPLHLELEIVGTSSVKWKTMKSEVDPKT